MSSAFPSFAAKGHCGPSRGLSAAGWRPALPESRENILFGLEIAGQIDHNTIHIKCLDARIRTPSAGSRGMLLRETAWKFSAAFGNPFQSIHLCEKTHFMICYNSTEVL